ncbi:hypothetical protein GCM10009118_22580 [Wandonia haliotis]|uniref:Uncharacterized protein n=1 Tax=Wandonia haliotis TaxID=574963 RepID=A0ABP3Y565_9FLAO
MIMVPVIRSINTWLTASYGSTLGATSTLPVTIGYSVMSVFGFARSCLPRSKSSCLNFITGNFIISATSDRL